MERAQFEKNSDIVIQSQVFAANVQTAFAVMRAQSTEAYEDLQKVLANKSFVPVKPGILSPICSIKGNNPNNA
jgi:hypothetical protein